MKILGFIIFLGIHLQTKGQEGQSFNFTCGANFNGVPIELNTPYFDSEGNRIQFSMVKYYLSHFDFLLGEEILFSETNSYHLIDLENPESSSWAIEVPLNYKIDQVKLHLGIDSLTNVSGAMSGDLDPTLGMYWTWQSGYINVKLEGTFNDEKFVYHLGGYSGKLNALQNLEINQIADEMSLDFELGSLFKSPINYSVMSPGEQAVEMSKKIAESISTNE